MKLAEGVDLHFIKTNQFKNNHITFRFSGRRDIQTMARRALVAQMLATASSKYSTSKQLREYLASLYGAGLSTSVTTKGSIHIVDIDVNFLQDRFTLTSEGILDEILELLNEILFNPLVLTEQFHPKIFEIEKNNLVKYLESDQEDAYYLSSLGLQNLYFDSPEMKISKYGSIELIEQETSFTAYQEFQKMLKEDKIDIFVLGDVDDYHVARYLAQLPFDNRKIDITATSHQSTSNIVKEKVVKKDTKQSILQLGYHVPMSYGDNQYPALLVAEGMLGGFSHSKLFKIVREKESLAYSVGSQLDIFSHFLKIYAGIDKHSRPKVLKLISQQLSELRLGRFSSQLLKQTKQMLISNAKMSQDNPKSLIEQVYNRINFNRESMSLDTFIEQIDKVTKQEVVKVMGAINLQAVYFLEGD